MLAAFDPWILAFSLVTVAVTIWMGFRSAKTSKSASDFFVAGRSVSVGWNASAISGEYLSAASFMGVAGMVMSSGYDALWYPVCYACGYLFLLLFIAGPLRRFGAYTIPDFAEGRYDSPVFRKIAVIFVLFIGFFYTMPQMKGAGTTLAYIFPGLPYWVGVVLVGAVITLNVALGGMKGITLVQAFQYWAKMFAISVPIFVLMSVYGGYGKQLGATGTNVSVDSAIRPFVERLKNASRFKSENPAQAQTLDLAQKSTLRHAALNAIGMELRDLEAMASGDPAIVFAMLSHLAGLGEILWVDSWTNFPIKLPPSKVPGQKDIPRREAVKAILDALDTAGACLIDAGKRRVLVAKNSERESYEAAIRTAEWQGANPVTLPAKAPADATWLNAFGPLTTNLISLSTRMTVESVNGWVRFDAPPLADRLEDRAKALFGNGVPSYMVSDAKLASVLIEYARFTGKTVAAHTNLDLPRMLGPMTIRETNWSGVVGQYTSFLTSHGVFLRQAGSQIMAMPPAMAATLAVPPDVQTRLPLPAKAPKDETWLNPFGPLTTKAAKAAKATYDYSGAWVVLGDDSPTTVLSQIEERFQNRNTQYGLPGTNYALHQIFTTWAGLESTARRKFSPDLTNHYVALGTLPLMPREDLAGLLKGVLRTNGVIVDRDDDGTLRAFFQKDASITPVDPKPYALLYTYSLIIALVCGTAGLPHILVRFYTNPDGVAAKRTTMWVMILIGIFYVFPPVFGVMGRNLMPSLYEGTGAKGTDKVVLELPKVLDTKDGGIWKTGKQEDGKTGVTGSVQSSTGAEPASPQSQIANRKSQIPWGSILSGITCAGAFAAFMSTFSGLLVSMTGALAHDVYGRMLRPNSTPAERMRMFKFCAVAVGTVAVVLGSFVEPLQINFMVGQAFAIAAASYFPLLFMSVWWRGMTMRGAAAGMLTGGVCALAAVTLTNFSDLKWIALGDFWAAHPLLRILCEQPAIWTVPLAIGLMVAVSKLTRATVPADVRMKMLVLHAPEKLGLKQEYIKEHEAHRH
jgi:Na+(H+)/acetate symporter ActP